MDSLSIRSRKLLRTNQVEIRCPIVGKGTDADPIRPAIADRGVNWEGEIIDGEFVVRVLKVDRERIDRMRIPGLRVFAAEMI